MTRALPSETLARSSVPPFGSRVREATGKADLRSTSLDVLQVNTGLLCNQECVHCHVESSPRRKEMMARETMDAVVRLARDSGCSLVDITGGAPELHPDFRGFVEELVGAGSAVQVRTNLTVLLLPKYRDLPEFFRERRVRLVASLPCYLEENVERQRGDGVFGRSVEALQALNRVGYGVDPELPLNLVYNPVGAHLPPPQAGLEKDYRAQLRERFGISFTGLFTITNMPIGRFLEDLEEQGADVDYVRLLGDSFNSSTLEGLMCRRQISVRWDGKLFDCDFNLALDMPARSDGRALDVRDVDAASLVDRRVVTAGHCFGCTAGAGSSCSGALV